MNVNFLFTKTFNFLFALDPISVAKINKSLELLERFGNNIHYPHTKHIVDGIFELRVIGARQIRIFFTFQNSEVYILHAITKKTDKIPKKEISYVLSLKKRLQ